MIDDKKDVDESNSIIESGYLNEDKDVTKDYYEENSFIENNFGYNIAEEFNEHENLVTSVCEEEKPLYIVSADWSYIVDEYDNPKEKSDYGLYVMISDENGEISYERMEYIYDADDCEAYALIDGSKELIYKRSYDSSKKHEELAIYRNDLIYNISWECGPTNEYDTDLSVSVYEQDIFNGKKCDSIEDYYRSYSGMWFIGICSISEGNYCRYDASWLEEEMNYFS